MSDLEKLSTLYDDQKPPQGAWSPMRSKVPDYCRECGSKLPWYLIGICEPCFSRAANE